jgi:hypothetical protein
VACDTPSCSADFSGSMLMHGFPERLVLQLHLKNKFYASIVYSAVTYLYCYC